MELLRVTPATQNKRDTNSSVLRKIFQLKFFQTPLHKPSDERHELQPPARPAALVTNSTIAENVEYIVDGHAAFKISKACFVIPGMPIPDQHLSSWATSHKERIEDEILTWIRQFCDRAHVELQMVRDKSGKVGPCVLLICWNDACCDTEANREALKSKVQKRLRRQQSMQSCPFPCLTVVEKTVLKSQGQIGLHLLRDQDCMVNTPKRAPWSEVNYLIGAGINYRDRRLSTLGGVLWIQGAEYTMTALHPFDSLSCQANSDGVQIHESSDESLSHSLSDVEYSDEDTDEDLFNGSTEDLSFTSLQRQPSQSVPLRATLEPGQRSQHSQDSPYPLTSIITGETTTSTQATLSGDWLLLKLKPDRSFRANGYTLPTTGSRVWLDELASQLPPHGTEVFVLTGDFGTRRATIGQSRIKMLVSGLQLSVFQICLKMPLESGTSGSWVVKDNAVLGFVVAGQESWPIAYCISFTDFVDSLKTVLGDVHVSLMPGPTCTHGHNSTECDIEASASRNLSTINLIGDTHLTAHGERPSHREISTTATEAGPSVLPDPTSGLTLQSGNSDEEGRRNLKRSQGAVHAANIVSRIPQTVDRSAATRVQLSRNSVTDLLRGNKYGKPMAASESLDAMGRAAPDSIYTPAAKTRARRVVDCVVAALTFYILSLAAVGITPHGPEYLSDLGVQSEILDTLVISAYTGGAAAAPLAVSISRSFCGKTWMSAASWVLFALWNLLSFTVGNAPTFLVYRTLAGLSAGCLVQSTLEQSSIKLLSFEGLSTSVASCIGLLVGPIVFGQASKLAFFVTFTVVGTGMVLLTILLASIPKKTPKVRPKHALRWLRAVFRYAMRMTWIYEWRLHFGALADPLFAFFIIYASALLGCVLMLISSLTAGLRQTSSPDTIRSDIALIAPGSGAVAGLWPVVLYRGELKRRSPDDGDRRSALQALLRLIATNLYLVIGLFWYGWSLRASTSPVTAIVGNAWAVFGAVASLILTAKFISITFDSTVQRHSTPLILMFGSLATVTFSLAEQQMHQHIGFGPTSSIFAGLLLICEILLLVARIYHRPVFGMSKALNPQL